MDKSNQLFHFMGFKKNQVVTCIHNNDLTEEVVVQSKWALLNSSYSIQDLMRMEQEDGDIITHFGDDVCNPFYCWNDAMGVIEKIEITPCNEGFPTFTMTSKYFTIEVDGETFIVQKELTDNKLEILESLVHEFLDYYYKTVEIID